MIRKYLSTGEEVKVVYVGSYYIVIEREGEAELVDAKKFYKETTQIEYDKAPVKRKVITFSHNPDGEIIFHTDGGNFENRNFKEFYFKDKMLFGVLK